MGSSNAETRPDVAVESQTLRALIQIRELIVRGEFKPGERIREIPLSQRLGVSRTPLRLVLDRLEREGLLQARPTGGFVVREFTLQDILDTLELRGVLEGTAARLAAERLQSEAELEVMRETIEEALTMLRNPATGIEMLSVYAELNTRFHTELLDLARSPMLRRSLESVLTLPFASPNAFIKWEAKEQDWRETLLVSIYQHRGLTDAIGNREGARAESLAREHSKQAGRNLTLALKARGYTGIPAGSLIHD